MTYRELQGRIQRQYGEREATLLSHHTSISMIIGQALGGGKKNGVPDARDPERKDVTAGAATVEDAIAAMNRMLSV